MVGSLSWESGKRLGGLFRDYLVGFLAACVRLHVFGWAEDVSLIQHT